MRAAFSLVELSIVLVILGLLTGGVLTGQSLIRAAELRSVTTSLSSYQTAIFTFRDKYSYLPGDMTNATDFWGSAGGTGSDTTCHAVATTDGSTCNGDGNGKIGGEGTNTHGETFRAWQQLANAGLVEGNYPGVTSSGGTRHHVPGYNVPTTKFGNGGVSLEHNCQLTNADWYPICENLLVVGVDQGNWQVGGKLFSPEEAWNIDTKLDDGLPGQGRIQAPKSSSTNSPDCTTSTDAATAEYKFSQTGAQCPLIIKLGM